MSYLSVRTGSEVATVAWQDLGWSTVSYFEIEAFPRAVLWALESPDAPRHYSPEQVLALHVFWQAVLDLHSRSGQRLKAAQFLAGIYPCTVTQTFWAGILGLDAQAARAQALERYGTAIAHALAQAKRDRPWPARQRPRCD